jgi:hypothetical protein
VRAKEFGVIEENGVRKDGTEEPGVDRYVAPGRVLSDPIRVKMLGMIAEEPLRHLARERADEPVLAGVPTSVGRRPERAKRAGEIRPFFGHVKGDGQPSGVCWRRRGFYCASPFMGPLDRAGLHHAAQLGNHIQALLLAQVLGTHDRLLVEEVAGPGLLLEMTLDDVDGLVHVLAGNLAGLLVGDSKSHLSCTSFPSRIRRSL